MVTIWHCALSGPGADEATMESTTGTLQKCLLCSCALCPSRTLCLFHAKSKHCSALGKKTRVSTKGEERLVLPTPVVAERMKKGKLLLTITSQTGCSENLKSAVFFF